MTAEAAAEQALQWPARSSDGATDYFLIDESDRALAERFEWRMTAAGYVYALFPCGKFRWLTAMLLPPRAGFIIDHIDRAPSNNRRSNLRYLTHADNMANVAVRRHSKSGIKGVRFHAQSGTWGARIVVDRKEISLGNFKDRESAAATFVVAHRYYHPALYPGFSDLLLLLFGTTEMSWSARLASRRRDSAGRFLERLAQHV